ncbi:MAG: HEAT repeat domain-containing protein [Pirellulales bacterium]|nr:HEAT repeat domain-containing protein [Pirellulales bacterium]
MAARIGQRCWILLVTTAMILPGCAEMPTWVPFNGPVSDEIPGLVTPAKKITQLQRLAQAGPESSPQEKRAVVEYLTQTIRTEADPLVRAEIIRTAGAYPIPEAALLLTAALKDTDADARVAACEAWGKRGDAQAAHLLAGMLRSDEDHDVRLAAARALGFTHEPEAIAALGEMLMESDPAMQYRAVLSLKQITGEDLGNNVDRWRQYVQEGRAQPAKPSWLAKQAEQWF